MATTTYSFSDIQMVLQFPGRPAYTLNGQGVGELSISYINDNTTHDLAADGSVMVSKIKANNANITLTMQQTSTMHAWLQGTFNYLYNSATALWAAGTITISSPYNDSIAMTLTGVSFTKRADQPFQQQGQMVTWNLMAADTQGFGSFNATLSTSAEIMRNSNANNTV